MPGPTAVKAAGLGSVAETDMFVGELRMCTPDVVT